MMSDASVAALAGIRKRYGSIVALDGLDLEVLPGALLAVLGENGAGKTTAIGVLLGLVRPDAGEVSLFGRPPAELAARRHVGVMLQEATLPAELRVREHIDLVASYYPAPLAVGAALELCGLGALAERPYGRLSGGQKRLVQLAIALCGRPRLLFLDEPTVGLDLEARERLWAALRQLVGDGVAIVLTSHDLEEVGGLADRVLVLGAGRAVASGTVDELRALVDCTHVSIASRLDVDEVAAWAEVTTASRARDRLELTARVAEPLVRRLLAADPEACDLEVRRAGLADAFRALVSGTGDRGAS
jgi:ABC-2 type transport system ATP-binding protein